MESNKILNIIIPTETEKDILEKIKKYIKQPTGFFHIVSLNPENLIIAQQNQEFKKVIKTAQIKLIDGIGIVLAGWLQNISLKRFTGIEMMAKLIKLAEERRLTVLLIGGKPNLALRLTQCYQNKYHKAIFYGLEGIKNIKKPQKTEEKAIFNIVSDIKPNIVIAAFGSPDQELWLARHADQFAHCVCIGVGGAFDFLSGEVPRAPLILQKIGLEWLFRLTAQPWRFKRQLKLLKFVWLVLREKIDNLKLS
jgi:N-acetylglucosaminyldiphosphoundecaprenol N-acetyl-beta-D-mannosaminyltransferase